MDFIATGIEGLIVVEPKVFKDSRGYFFESFNKKTFQEAGILSQFVQDNQSFSKKDVLRGLHFQKPPYAQAKLVSVIQGAVLDVAVDLRRKSQTYGKYYSVELTGENKKMMFIPEGFAHGFATLQDDTIFSYKCSNLYHKDSEASILWNDNTLNIDWQIDNPILSEKDIIAPKFNQFDSPF